MTDTAVSSEFVTGECKWFSVNKGYGFIKSQDGEDIFVHMSALQGDSNQQKSLVEGETVEFQIMVDKDGRKRAVSVQGPGGAELNTVRVGAQQGYSRGGPVGMRPRYPYNGGGGGGYAPGGGGGGYGYSQRGGGGGYAASGYSSGGFRGGYQGGSQPQAGYVPFTNNGYSSMYNQKSQSAFDNPRYQGQSNGFQPGATQHSWDQQGQPQQQQQQGQPPMFGRGGGPTRGRGAPRGQI